MFRDDVRAAAKGVGVTERTVWQWLRDGLPAGGPGHFCLTQEDLDAYYAWKGSVAGAWRDAVRPAPACPRCGSTRAPSSGNCRRVSGRWLLKVWRAGAKNRKVITPAQS